MYRTRYGCAVDHRPASGEETAATRRAAPGCGTTRGHRHMAGRLHRTWSQIIPGDRRDRRAGCRCRRDLVPCWNAPMKAASTSSALVGQLRRTVWPCWPAPLGHLVDDKPVVARAGAAVGGLPTVRVRGPTTAGLHSGHPSARSHRGQHPSSRRCLAAPRIRPQSDQSPKPGKAPRSARNLNSFDGPTWRDPDEGLGQNSAVRSAHWPLAAAAHSVDHHGVAGESR